MNQKNKPICISGLKHPFAGFPAVGLLCAVSYPLAMIWPFFVGTSFYLASGIFTPAHAKQRFLKMPEIPAGLDLARESASQDQAETFVVLEPKEQLPLGKLHNWKICSKRNAESEKRSQNQKILARLNFIMPQHQHGIGTTPRIKTEIIQSQDLLFKDYAYCFHAEGVRFHMAGWWQLQLEVTGDGLSPGHQGASRFAAFNWILQ